MSQLLTESKWAAVKDKLVEGLNGNRKTVMEAVLDNQRKVMLRESATAGATSAGNIATLNKVILPIIRRVMPTVIANEIIGVQPMTGPVGQIHTLRVQYADNAPGVIAGEEALSPYKIAKSYTGEINSDNTAPRAAPTSQLEGVMGRRVNIRILRETVEAQSRRLSARWTVESAQDAQAQHGIDVEAELMAAIAQEITTEIDQELLARLRALPGAAAVVYDQSKVTGVATFVGDEHAALATLINRQANEVARRTKRGAANWAVVSPTALTILQSATTSSFARTTEGTFEAPTNVKFVGVLNSTMRVYVDTYADDSTDVLIGYKGNQETDAGAFYCPYIPLMASGTVMDPNTGELVTSFLTRYGYVQLTDSTSSLGNAADYYSKIAIRNVTFM
ncbi:Phage major capsid protein of Caudovirales [Yersinia phage fHe-Yen9-04]|uniref:Phage major capsid protein of Caudovirales n=2 Tax=Eneladusvirus Yen904 TaxID=2560849 RepID=A0A2C9CXH7_9CAUD|nr:major head protein [Yersinia phage fHe-Yen9-04]SOK58527.1 Phage major capsid protein of Caudovirales [Yersinia phage fHe-Yen9-04]SOK59061.1 Phage major capsid protein of Caudovirales [Yersinia phage fHe-Yen9-03]VUE36296.1 Phage major capsid protein of Caudovirales [Yersinia phage fHe-Yen9-04]